MLVVAKLYWNEFQEALPPILAALKFALSDECRVIISALKRMAWSENAAAGTCRSQVDFKIIPSVYTQTYWRGSSRVHNWLFLDQNDEFSIEFDNPKTMEALYNKLAANYDGRSNLDVLLKFIDEKIIKPGKFQGESKEVIFATAAKNCFGLLYFNGQHDLYKGHLIFLLKYSH
jgi:hypothetical protein